MMTDTGVEPGDVLCAEIKGMRFGAVEVLDARWDYGADWNDERIVVFFLTLSEPGPDDRWPPGATRAIKTWVKEHAVPLLRGMWWYTQLMPAGVDDTTVPVDEP